MSRALIATYRLQLNDSFTLHDARARVPYLRALGISHLYCSPVLAARRGSTHGYDVADPTHVSASLGGDAAFVALAETAHAHEMRIVLDIVPNHMGIGPENPYWDDVLANGQHSRYAEWFDVAWRAPTRRLAGKVLVPVLGDTLAKVLARDEITLKRADGAIRLHYFDHHFPLDPRSVPAELRDASTDAIAAWSSGDAGRERLTALLARQYYELAFWRTAQRDLNYRRFFDVNELISLRVERPDVFEATHATVLRFVADGLVDGLRVDHIDGLLEPRRYLERLRAALDERCDVSRRVPILVEKILAPGERLPESWPVDGTTGYEFMTSLEDTLIDPDGYAAIESRYRVSRDGTFHELAVASKRRVLRGALNADVRRIAPMLASLAAGARWPKRTIADYARAIVEFVAALAVYRTYMDAEHPQPNAEDRKRLTDALDAARDGDADQQALDALGRVLLDESTNLDAEWRGARLGFVLRLQQLTGPAAAKGVEDTALYVYAPLTSRNEVGGDPGLPLAGADDRLHDRLLERSRRFPLSLNATNTHDTKRSADARARLDALSEHAESWADALRRWRRRNRPLRSRVRGTMVPSPRVEDFIYQAMIAVWPLTAATLRTNEWIRELEERLIGYMEKASREAKVSTTWTDPDTNYERAIAGFLSGLLDRGASAEFQRDVEAMVSRLAPQALWNALSRIVVHLTAPGVPDIYRGDELWFAALVDPDNRRPVDWEERSRALDRLSGGDDANALKLRLTHDLLLLRRERMALMADSTYEPLTVAGEYAVHVLAFRRVGRDGDTLISVCARRTAALAGPPLGEVWGDTAIRVGDDKGMSFRCAVHGTTMVVSAGELRVADLFREVPVAVLTSQAAG